MKTASHSSILQHPATGEENKREVAILTGGADKPYTLGLAQALVTRQIPFDFIGSDQVNGPQVHGNQWSRFLNLRGDQRSDAGCIRKLIRVLRYYVRLMHYAAISQPRIFHILWNNKFEWFDRTLLMGYYRLMGKRLVLTVHNVNSGKRDGIDSLLNRMGLRSQYRLADHLLVHTRQMAAELQCDFGISPSKITVIPFGINNTLPDTTLTPLEARRRLGLQSGDRVLLFFGLIAPYKGLEYLVSALAHLAPRDTSYRLVIGGRPKGDLQYWNEISRLIVANKLASRIVQRISFIPDEDVEIFTKAADVLVLPYTHIFQSGVLFVAYWFGLPVIAADVGSFREDVIEGETGFLFKPRDSRDLARAIEVFYSSTLYHSRDARREGIKAFAKSRYSWTNVIEITQKVYADVARRSQVTEDYGHRISDCRAPKAVLYDGRGNEPRLRTKRDAV